MSKDKILWEIHESPLINHMEIEDPNKIARKHAH